MKNFILFLVLILFTVKMSAQYLEVGATGGLSSYYGDLQPSAPANGSFGVTYGAFARYNYRPNIAFKVSGLSGKFYATDRYARNSRRFRNLESETQYYELAATAEWNLTKFDIIDGKTTAPYLFAGVAGFYFNPRGRSDFATNTWVDLQPLGTEGQTLPGGKLYSQFQVAIPVGLGMKISISQKINVGFEAGLRYTFTDYLDDVSGSYPDLVALKELNPLAFDMSFRTPVALNRTLDLPSGQKRGDNYKNDIYYYIGGTISFNIGSREKMEFNKSYRNFFNSK